MECHVSPVNSPMNLPVFSPLFVPSFSLFLLISFFISIFAPPFGPLHFCPLLFSFPPPLSISMFAFPFCLHPSLPSLVLHHASYAFLSVYPSIAILAIIFFSRCLFSPHLFISLYMSPSLPHLFRSVSLSFFIPISTPITPPPNHTTA